MTVMLQIMSVIANKLWCFASLYVIPNVKDLLPCIEKPLWMSGLFHIYKGSKVFLFRLENPSLNWIFRVETSPTLLTFRVLIIETSLHTCFNRRGNPEVPSHIAEPDNISTSLGWALSLSIFMVTLSSMPPSSSCDAFILPV